MVASTKASDTVDMVEVEVVKPTEVASKPKVFVFKPSDGSDPIEFPLEFVRPDKRWLWEMYNETFLTQTFEWMKRANVSKEAQRQAVSLSDEDYMRLFTEWFEAIGGGATPGE